MKTRMTRLGLVGLGIVIAVLQACTASPTRDLSELVIQDSIYYTPETMEPYSGDVLRYFSGEPEKVELQGHLTEGEWDGELVVYHLNGRVRYMGSFSQGERCGAWTENSDPDPPGSVFEQLKQEVEAMGLYPPCEG